MQGDFCPVCKMPYDTLVRDEARLSVYQVLTRCAACSHIIVYRSSGMPEPSEGQIQRVVHAHLL